MPTVRANGADFYYELTGSGPHLVQISGAVSGHEAYGPITPVMAEHFTVLDFDHRGYGKSDRPEQAYDMGVWSSDLAAMLDALGIDRAHIHGGSMGAFIAVDFAVNHPDRVDKLILGGGAAKSGYWAQCMFRIWQDLANAYGVTSDELIRAIMVTGFSQATLDQPGFGEDLVEGIRGIISRNVTPTIFQQACQAMIDYDVTDRLERITAPTLVMVGSDDNLTPLHQEPSGAGMQYMADHIPTAELAIVPNAGHAHLFERPGESCEIILEFLRRDG